jgi:hypothetical protein
MKNSTIAQNLKEGVVGKDKMRSSTSHRKLTRGS